MDDAVERSRAYLEAGADGILIHSCEKDVKEIQAFVIVIESSKYVLLYFVCPPPTIT